MLPKVQQPDFLRTTTPIATMGGGSSAGASSGRLSPSGTTGASSARPHPVTARKLSPPPSPAVERAAAPPLRLLRTRNNNNKRVASPPRQRSAPQEQQNGGGSLKRVDSLSNFASLSFDGNGDNDNDESLEPSSSSSSAQRRSSCVEEAAKQEVKQRPSSTRGTSLSDARRSLSDTIISRQPRQSSSASSNGGTAGISASSHQLSSQQWGGAQQQSQQLPRTNATFSLVQRSGSKLIKDIIESMDRKVVAAAAVASAEDDDDAAPLQLPDTECSALANCSLDPYYRVIVAASGGIRAIVRALDAFPLVESVQASGCAALAAVSTKNASNQNVAGREGGLEAVLQAMRNFEESSVGVRSAACDALNSMTGLCPRNVEALKSVRDFEEVMTRALDQFLPSSCREGAKAVLRRTRAAAD